MKVRLSLVSTVFNDLSGVQSFFDTLASTVSPAPLEIIIVDAGSSDGTWEALQSASANGVNSYPVIVLQEKGCNVARGRNLAIERANSEIIVSTDIGCDWDNEWLSSLSTPLLEDESIDLVIGSWAVEKEGLTGPWALTEWALKGDQKLIADRNSYSSSRSIAYRKSTWDALGRYPEDLTLAGDDALFHYLIEEANVNRIGVPDVHCRWHRHTELEGFFKESFRYGLGDGEAGIRRKDAVVVGARLIVEFVSFLVGATFLLPLFPNHLIIAGLVFLPGIISFALRTIKLRGALDRLASEQVSYPMLRLLVFIYGNKFHWLRGHFAGFLRGSRFCADSQGRLRKMTPEVYQKHMADQL